MERNDGGDKGAGDRVREITLQTGTENPLCDGESCLDMALLDNLINKWQR